MNIEVLKALASEIRFEIVCMLVTLDMTAGEIAERFDISQPSVSRHLQVLKHAGVVSVTRDCTKIYYSLNHEYLNETVEELKALLKL